MGSSFQRKTANGIEIEMWDGCQQDGRSEARSLAGRLPRGGEIGEGSIRRIDAPIRSGSEVDVWLDGDGFAQFEIPDGYEVESVSGFDTPGTCITMRKTE
jgi:hypothetical protein